MSEEKVPKQAYIVVPNDGVKRVAMTRDELKRSYDRKCMSHWNFEKWADELFGGRDGKG